MGDGTKEKPILISSYGEGELPVINAGLGAGYGIKIYNNDYYKIADVAFAHSVAGIYVVSDLRNIDMQTYRFDALKGIYVQNCVFTDIQAPEVTSQSGLIKYPDMSFGAGIHFTAYGFNLVKGGQKYGTWGTRADGKNIQSPLCRGRRYAEYVYRRYPHFRLRIYALRYGHRQRARRSRRRFQGFARTGGIL